MDANWLRLKNELLTKCAKYKQTKTNHNRLDSFCKQLVLVLGSVNVAAKPSEETIAKVRKAIKEHRFQNINFKSVFKTFEPIPIHQNLLDLFLETRQLNDAEIVIFRKLQKVIKKIEKNDVVNMLSSLNVLRLKHGYKQTSELKEMCDLKLQHAYEFCLGVSKMRVEMLQVCGFDKCNDVKQKMKEYDEMRKKTDCTRFAECYWPLYLQLGDLHVAIKQKTAEEIMTAVNNASRPKYCVDLLVDIANKEKCGEIGEKLSAMYGRNAATRFGKKSPFHQSLIDSILEGIDNKQHVAFKETHSRLVLGQFCTFIEPIETYTLELFPDKKENALKHFFDNATREEFIEAMRFSVKSHKAHNSQVKSSRGGHHCTSAVTRALHFVKKEIRRFIKCDLSNLNARTILVDVQNQRVAQPVEKRRTLNDEEYERMLNCARDPCEKLLLVLLREVGLRNGALQHLKYSDVVDSEHYAKHTCFAKEKGNRRRSFITSQNLKETIQKCSLFLREKHADEVLLSKGYILRSDNNVTKPLISTWIGETLKRLAQTANVTEVHVHAHAFRHTLVSKLMSAGNSIETVSKFIGHSDSRTTSFFYWLPQPEEINNLVINPFTEDYDKQRVQEQDSKVIVEAANAKVSASRKLLDTLMKLAPEQTLKKFNEMFPDVQETLRAIDTTIDIEFQKEEDDESKAASFSDFEDNEPRFKKHRPYY